MQLTISDLHKRTLRKQFLSLEEVEALLDLQKDGCYDVRLLNELLFHISLKELLVLLKKFSYYNPISEYVAKKQSDFSHKAKEFEQINLALVGTNVFHFLIPYLILKRPFQIRVVWVRQKSIGSAKNVVNKLIVYLIGGLIVERDELATERNSELKDYIIFHKLNFIIPKKIIEFFPKGIINDHWGTLPYYRGRSTFEYQTLFNHKKMFTNHLISEGIDSGDIICYTECTPFLWWSKYIKLYKRIKLSTLGLSLGHNTLYPNILSEGATFYEMHSDLTRLLKNAS